MNFVSVPIEGRMYIMKFGFVGAGKVGKTFGTYLSQNGHEVVGYYSKTYDHAIEASLSVKGVAYDSLEKLLQNVDVVLLTVTDQMIHEVSRELCSLKGIENIKFVIHMSGALSSSVLERYQGVSYASIHPMQAFANVEEALEQMPNTVFGLEGDDDAVSTFEVLLKNMGNEVIKLTEAQKVNYHLAAVIASNYLVTLVHLGLKQMNAIGIDENTGIKALLPLIKGTLANIEAFGTERSLTGPIARGDYKTVEAHLQAMDKEAEALYKHLGRATLELVQTNELSVEKVQALRHLLEEE